MAQEICGNLGVNRVRKMLDIEEFAVHFKLTPDPFGYHAPERVIDHYVRG